jgi:serine/threonine protein kinase
MLSPGTVIGDYEIVAFVGAGGMAMVYQARHRILNTTHAVKILKPHHAASEELRERFLAEGRIQARIKHRNIVDVTGVIVEPGVAGLVMTYLDGPTLAEHIAGRALPAEEIGALMLPLLEGVAAVHALGIVHRDLKPDNIKVLPDGQPVLFDFGVARLTTDDAADEVGHRKRFKTRAGRRMGTPGYMSPEQVEGDPSVDARTDVFALGCILYELISGQKAFVGESEFVIMKAIVSGDRTPLAEVAPEAPAALVACTERALSRQAADRQSDARALHADLTVALAPEPEPLPPVPPPRRQRRVWPALLVLLMLGGLATVIGGGGLAWMAARQSRADRIAAEAMAILEHHKTDPKANDDPALLAQALSEARRARDIAQTPDALGAVALAQVWSQGWQLASFDADAVNAHFHDIDALTRQAAGAGTGEGALARALVASTACARLPATDARRRGLCEEASTRFDEAAERLARADRAWLRFEVWWTAAEHHNLLAAGWWAAGGRENAEAEWRRTLTLCGQGTADIDDAPVNDVFLARQCLVAAGGTGQYADYVGWARWLAGHDTSSQGRLTDWSAARIYQAAHPDCRTLERSRSSRSAWIPHADTDTARRCYFAGLMALSCSTQAAEVAGYLDRSDPMVVGIRQAARDSAAACYLD